MKESDVIKNALQNIGTRIEAPDSLKQRIDFQIVDGFALEGTNSQTRKGVMKMKHMSMKKVVLGVAAACVMVGAIAIAGSGVVSSVGHGSSVPDYTKFEDMGKAETEIGYSVDAVEGFSNGFRFDDIHIIEETLQDESGQSMGKKKNIEISYSRGKDDVAVYVGKMLSVENADFMTSLQWDKTLQVGDVVVGYRYSTYKAVPPNYEPTEEEKKEMENGHLQIGYGSDKIEVSQCSDVMWVKDGVFYEMVGFDVSLSADDLLNMAREIIESGGEG